MSHYDVLGVGSSADGQALHRAYLALARRHHPDVVGGDAARMQAINDAWATLGDPARRALYDRSLAPTSASASQSHDTARFVDLDDLDAADEDLDLDDRPVRITVALPRWLSLVPVATFAASVLVFCVGMVLSSEALLALAMMCFALACVFFLSAPFLALFAARRSAR